MGHRTLESMKPPHSIISLVCVVVSILTSADEHPGTKTNATGAAHPTSADLQLLQGTWKGFEVTQTENAKSPDFREISEHDATEWDLGVGNPGVPGASAESRQKITITITITGNTFHFHRDTNFWFETTIALPPGTQPKQFHATIKNCPPSQEGSVGKVVGAIYKIEGDRLTVAAYDLSEEPPKTFTSVSGLYRVKKVQPQEKRAEPPKAK